MINKTTSELKQIELQQAKDISRVLVNQEVFGHPTKGNQVDKLSNAPVLGVAIQKVEETETSDDSSCEEKREQVVQVKNMKFYSEEIVYSKAVTISRNINTDFTLNSIHIVGTIQGCQGNIFVDPGSEVNLVTLAWLGNRDNLKGHEIYLSPFKGVTAFNNGQEKILGRVFMEVDIAKNSRATLPFEIVKESTGDILVGMGSLKDLNIVIDGKRQMIEFGDKMIDFSGMTIDLDYEPPVCMVSSSKKTKFQSVEVAMNRPPMDEDVNLDLELADKLNYEIRSNNILNKDIELVRNPHANEVPIYDDSTGYDATQHTVEEIDIYGTKMVVECKSSCYS